MEKFSHKIMEMLEIVFPPVDETPPRSLARQFIPVKSLAEKDTIIIDMLNSQGHEEICYCICDPDFKDCPIVFSSDGFCSMTGYNHEEIEGRNCRFLQGPETDEKDIDRIRQAIKAEVETSVNLLNYKKDGTPFINEFFLSPLHDSKGVTIYYIGVQCPVQRKGPGQAPLNAG